MNKSIFVEISAGTTFDHIDGQKGKSDNTGNSEQKGVSLAMVRTLIPLIPYTVLVAGDLLDVKHNLIVTWFSEIS